jgi:hypothetical protein
LQEAPAAQTPTPAPAPTPTPSPQAPAPHEPDAPADDGSDLAELYDKRIDVHARVRMGAALDDSSLRVGTVDVRQEQLSLALTEARVGVDLQALDWLSLTVELDLAGKPMLKDGFVRAESSVVRGQVGQFKMPISAMTLESPWKLPMADRGILQAILAEHVQMLGRRQGLSVRLRAKGKLRPELTLGVFQGLLANSNDPLVPDFTVTDTIDSQNAVARAGLRLLGVELGIAAERISTLVAMRVRHFWVAGIDATADYELSGHAVRFWLEAFTGTTWKAEALGASQPEARFGTTRGILAWRVGGMHKGEAYVEPFVMGGLFDPELDASSDLVLECKLGATAGLWGQLRLTLEGSLAGSQSELPDQIFVTGALMKRKAIELQLGAAF